MSNESGWCTRFKLMLAFAASMAAIWPAIAQDSDVEIAPSSVKLLRFDSPFATIIIGDSKIADATAQAGNIVVLTGKTIGTTLLSGN
jgi:Flp pilus assembly secretin CpaC